MGGTHRVPAEGRVKAVLRQGCPFHPLKYVPVHGLSVAVIMSCHPHYPGVRVG